MTRSPGRPEPAFRPSGFFDLRTPLLSFDEYLAWNEGLEAASRVGDPELLAAAHERDRLLQRRRLQDLVRRTEIREALFLASPDLDDALESWFRDPEGDRGQRAERAIVKYVSRMAGRATPFGLFAGGALGVVGKRTRLTLGPRDAYRRQTRLDTDYLSSLADSLGSDALAQRELRFHPNSTAYAVGGKVRYVESRTAAQERTYHLVSVEESSPLAATLERAAEGATVEALAEALVDEEIGHDEAEAYVRELVEAQILVPDVGLRITGNGPSTSMVETLGEHPTTRAAAARLEEANSAIAAIDEAGLGVDPTVYRRLASRLEELPVRPHLSRLFQVDMRKPAVEATLGRPVLEEIRRGIEILHRVTTTGGSVLRTFREAFTERFEEREVPLVEALDEESGIGFPAFGEEDSTGEPLLAGIPFPDTTSETAPWGPREKRLLRLLQEAVAAGSREIVLGEKDLEALSNPRPEPLPTSFAALVRIGASSYEALDRGDFQVVLESAGGPSGARFLGRFCQADPELRHHVEEHLRAEEALEPDAIFAELVHLPEGRSGNVIVRPLFRQWEIPYQGGSGAPADRQIPIADLLVSVRGDEVRIRSRRLGRRIVPRLTAAHNYVHYGLGLYRFLCALQAQGTAGGLIWDWGPLGAAPFLPRVRSGRTIFSPARWRVEPEEIERLAACRGSERFRAVTAWRRERGLPRFVLLTELADGLPIDFHSPLAIEAFVPLARSSGAVELKEMLPEPELLCARGPEGRFVHELLIPYVRSASTRTGPEHTVSPPAVALRRAFPPGSDWLYAKLYGGSATLDRILVEQAGPLAVSSVASGTADTWYFVRYADPRPHLRLRFHGEPRRLREDVLPALESLAGELLASRRIWKMQVDTYDREVERYGGATGIVLAERIFHADSVAVLEILQMLEGGDRGEEERWRLAVVGSDSLLDSLGVTEDEKRALVTQLRKGFGEEHREDAALKRALGESYRRVAVELAVLLDGNDLSGSPLGPGLELFAKRTEAIAPIAGELRRLASDGHLDRPVTALAASCVHMFLNRLLRSAHRRQELVIYDLLARLYAARAARSPGAFELPS